MLDRDPKGRFAKGNEGGPGATPYARRALEINKLLQDCVSESDLKEIMASLVSDCKVPGADAKKLQLLFDRIGGKPQQTIIDGTVVEKEVTLEEIEAAILAMGFVRPIAPPAPLPSVEQSN